MSNHPQDVMWSLWNPSTSMVIRLPPLINHEDGDISECCLPSPPDDPAGSILLLTRKGKHTFVFCRLGRGERERLKWTEMSYAEQIRSITGEDGFVHTLTCCNGKVYALIGDQELFVIEVDIVVTAIDVVVISVLPFVKLPPYSNVPGPNRYAGPFLKGTCTGLFIIYQYFKQKAFYSMHLFRLDMTHKLWEEVEDFDDAACFFDLDCSSNAIASKSRGGYIHRLCEKDKVMRSYHVKDKTLAISCMPRCQDLPPPPRSRTSYVSVWAMPECSRLEGEHKKINLRFDSIEEDDTLMEVEVNSMTSQSQLFNVPFHVLEMIMEFSVDMDYVNFRATCKQLTAPVTRWSNEASVRRLQRYSLVSPWLMVLDKDHGIMTFTDPMFGDQYSVRTPPEVNGHLQIWYSMYGWLLMSKDTESMMLFNPFTSDIRKLPNLEVFKLESFCFSAPPSSPDCMVVGFGGQYVFIHFVAWKHEFWRKFFLDYGGDAPSAFHYSISFSRDIYVLNREGRLTVLTNFWEDDNYSWVDVDVAPTSYCRTLAQYFLVKCDQDLLLVILDEFGKSLELLKLDRHAKKWEEIHGLGKNMIYICNTTCLCMEARTPEMENKIYFALLHPENEKIVFYSLDTCRYHTFSGKSIVESSGDLFGTKQHLNPHVWIEPSYS